MASNIKGLLNPVTDLPLQKTGFRPECYQNTRMEPDLQLCPWGRPTQFPWGGGMGTSFIKFTSDIAKKNRT